MSNIYGFGIYGMWGPITDSGEREFSNRVKELDVNIGNSPYRDYDYNIIVNTIKQLPNDSIILIWGSSLGANNTPYVATLAKRTVHGIWGFQASEYGMHCPVPSNVLFAHEAYNPNIAETFGLGAYEWVRSSKNTTTNLYLSKRYDMHPGETEVVQEMFLAEMKRVIANG